MDLRNPRLKKVFDDIVSGDRQLNDPLIPYFIKSISTHPDPATCLHALVTSEHGLKAVRTTVCSDLSVGSLNGDVAVLLAYLRDSKLEYLGGGDTLQRLLRALVQKPRFWNSLATAFSTGKLQRSTERSFSWLFFQLVASPPELSKKYRRLAPDSEIVQALLRSPDHETRSNGRKIHHIVSLYPGDQVVPSNWPETAGWRHSNDHRSYREISILPTPDEINSKERPCIRTVDQIDGLELTCPTKAFKAHAENQFRLLREDLVHDTRESVQIALGNKRGKRTGEFIPDIFLSGVYTGDKSKWGLTFTCQGDLPFLSSVVDDEDRKARLEKERNFLRHGSFACLTSGREVVAFVTIIRDIDLLAQDPPIIAVQLGGRAVARDVLHRLQRLPIVSLAQINTPLFAYEPVLRSLQDMKSIPLLLGGTLLTKQHKPQAAERKLSDIDQEFVHDLIRDLETTSNATKGIALDNAQTEAFICGLTQKVALIQGPPGTRFTLPLQSSPEFNYQPGTGKSFIGALLVKAFYKKSAHDVLVCCYTNHAFDQFLEDLLKQGIPRERIVRLGSKPSPSTQGMALSSYALNYRFNEHDWRDVSEMKLSLGLCVSPLDRAFSECFGPLGSSALLRHLESKYPTYFKALSFRLDGGIVLIGESRRPINATYLLSRWTMGQDAGVLRDHSNVIASRDIWRLSLEERTKLKDRWSEELLEDRVEAILEAGDRFNNRQEPLSAKFQQRVRQVLCSKRIIACTTTAAAIYRDAIREAGPEILVVEEAGEVLESHVLTALNNETKRLILIGDHK